jgi:MSHA biogenesis protein MshL
MVKKLLVCGLGVALTGCFQPMKPSVGHMQDPAPPGASSATIPPPVQAVPAPPKPRPTARAETYSVVVNNVNVRELLFALARDAKVNVDIHPGISGAVTLNAIDQTLPQLLNRIAKQVDMRYELDGPNLLVMPDSPYLRVYRIDYVNMIRQTQGQVSVSSEIVGQTGGGAGGGGGASSGGGGAGQNTSRVTVQNQGTNRFWDTLVKNVDELLRETDKIIPAGGAAAVPPPAAAPGAQGQPQGAAGGGAGAGSVAVAAIGATPNVSFREASSVIANPEASVLSVRASARQHEKLQEFLDQVLLNARRQVLIEATLVEVRLSNNYQQGIDWGIFSGLAGFQFLQGALYRTIPPATGPLPPVGGLTATPTANILTSQYNSANFKATIQLLETFGNVRVLSSPRISAINNQTAILKVVNNLVYFNVNAQTTQAQTTALTTFTTTPQTVPVGIVMNITAQISDADAVLLSVKPSISRVISFVNDPNPALAAAGVTNPVPQIAIREMESVMRLTTGQIAVMGGLIQDELTDNEDSIPFINRLPILGAALANRNILNVKTELVIFLRPIVIRDPSLEGDYRGYRVFLPNEDFMSQPNPGRRPCDFRIDVGCPQ